MTVKLRLTRKGRTHQPFYRIVAADRRKSRDGKFIEIIGRYQPLNPKEEERVYVEVDKALDWLKKGAVPSDTVKSIFRKKGIMKTFHDYKAEQAKAKKSDG
jgi:small subunit ribosomal protein S16